MVSPGAAGRTDLAIKFDVADVVQDACGTMQEHSTDRKDDEVLDVGGKWQANLTGGDGQTPRFADG